MRHHFRVSVYANNNHKTQVCVCILFMKNILALSSVALSVWVMWCPSAQRTTLALGIRAPWKTRSAILGTGVIPTRTGALFATNKAVRLSWQYQRPYRNVYAKVESYQKLYLSTSLRDDDVEIACVGNKTVGSTWNVPGLKKEVVRLVQRSHKMVQQAFQRVSKAKETVEQLATDPAVTVEELEQCPDLDALTAELENVQSRLRRLNALEESLSAVPNKKEMVLPEPIAALAMELGVNDAPPVRPTREKKEKGPRRDLPSRKPYRRYFSEPDGIEIRVGKKAEDNDELTLNPQYRDGSDWWMHAAGCPGSHVVIRHGHDTLPDNVVLDAAALAARQSKCTGSVIKVSLTRCRDIKKPPGAKAGLVMLTGKVRTVSVNMKEAEARLERLEKTVLVN
jgi:predicted ribosome quality control (RQC) complex YloA/Tae2 family protein